jgi:hemerythrin
MDRQHRKILTILNGIYYLEANDRRSLEQVFRSLESYIQRHFTDEEDLLLLHGYPGYDEQKLEHERFIDEICGYRQEFVKGRTPVMINMFNSVWDWLSRHILVLDKRYEPFLQARGCR